MAKLKMTGPGLVSEVKIRNTGENIHANALNIAGQLGAPGVPVTINGPTELEITNNHTLNVLSCDYILNSLEVNTGGILNFNNICPIGNAQTQINVGQNSTMIIAGKEMNLGVVVLDSGSIFNFVHKAIDFNIQIPLVPAPLVINDIHHLAELCVFLSNNDFGNKDFHLPLNHTHSLKLYEENKELVDIMLINNLAAIKHGNFVNPHHCIFNIEKYINTHFFELIGVKKFINTPKEVFNHVLPKNVVEEIGSYIDFDDIN